MASPFAFLRSATNKAHKTATKLADGMYNSLLDADKWQETYDTHFRIACNGALHEIRRMQAMKEVIEDEFNELMGIEPKEDRAFFITIRPDDTKSNFIDFKEKCLKLVTNAAFKEYALSFEQKGTSPDALGKGFHCHIVAKMSHKYKSQVLQYLKKSFKSWIDEGLIASNCIDVVVSKNPEEVVKKYLIDYECDDEHKSDTKSWDDLWRSHNDVLPLYSQKLLIAS